jgi:hypothetical protein
MADSNEKHNAREISERHKPQSKAAFCPACKYYEIDCHVDEDEWTLPCDYYEELGYEEKLPHGDDPGKCMSHDCPICMEIERRENEQ